jgi:hypothetical protein
VIALTLTEPWATLVVLGLKRFETRSWSTKQRRKILIHSAKGMPGWARECVFAEPFRSQLIAGLGVADEYEVNCLLDERRGHLIGGVRIIDVLPSDVAREQLSDDPRELAFGDYGPNRYAWQLDTPVVMPKFVPCKGALSLWRVPPLQEDHVRAAFAGYPAKLAG